jgi:hypothetical protein
MNWIRSIYCLLTNKAYSTVSHGRVTTDRARRQARSHLLKELNKAKSHFDLDCQQARAANLSLDERK